MYSLVPTVAVLDDEARFRQAPSRLLKTYGFRVPPFENGQDLLEAMRRESFDCLLLDLHIPNPTGFDILRHLTGRLARPPGIVIAGNDEPANAERVHALSAADYLLKPVEETALLKSFERCLAPTLLADFSHTKAVGQIEKENQPNHT